MGADFLESRLQGQPAFRSLTLLGYFFIGKVDFGWYMAKSPSITQIGRISFFFFFLFFFPKIISSVIELCLRKQDMEIKAIFFVLSIPTKKTDETSFSCLRPAS